MQYKIMNKIMNKIMKIIEHYRFDRWIQNNIEQSISRLALEIEELKRELAKMSTEIARLKTSQNKQEEGNHGRDQDHAR